MGAIAAIFNGPRADAWCVWSAHLPLRPRGRRPALVSQDHRRA
ncbi:hypothetical protein [Streptomyces oceani]|nr:hypothetical protein [Streptomyces oceani]